MIDVGKPEEGQAVPVGHSAMGHKKHVIHTRHILLKHISDQGSLYLQCGSVQHLVSAIAKEITGRIVWKPAFAVQLRQKQ